ncbi:hypothetical protein OBK01_02575 [Empedobacter falsenii]
MTKKEKNKFLIKMTVLANAMLYEMDLARVDSEEATQLRKLLEQHTQMAFEQPLLQSTTFIQEVENKFDAVVNRTAKEYNIKL